MKKKIIGILVCGLFFVSAYSGATNINQNDNNMIDKTSMYNELPRESIKLKINQNDYKVVDNSLFYNDPPGEWIKTYGMKKDTDNRFNFARITDDGSYIVTGCTDTYNHYYPAAWLVKTDSDGVMEWNKTYGADNKNGGYGSKVYQTTDKGYIIVGVKDWFTTDVKGWLIKTDKNGNVEWESTFGGIGEDRCYDVIEVGDGYYVCGRTYSYGAGDADGWVIKTDTNGKQIWYKTYGGAYYDNFYAMVKLAGGGFVLTGTSQSSSITHYNEFWCVKIDDNGNELWSKTYASNYGNYTAESVYTTVDGGYIMGGYAFVYDTQLENWTEVGVIAKIDGSGTMQWMKSYTRNQYNFVNWMDPTADGGYILSGSSLDASSSGYDIWLVKTDGSGNMEWERIFKKSFSYWLGLGSVQQIDDSSYIIAGDYHTDKGYAYLLKTTNTPPFKPDLPTGDTNGKAKSEYTYSTKAIDQKSEQLYYLFDWGDETNSSWLGPYNSGELIEASHTWTQKGSYDVKVKAKDSYDLESLWSDPLPITMPYSYNPMLQFLERLFERFPHAFPLLRQLMGY
jgi:hypothetical protein